MFAHPLLRNVRKKLSGGKKKKKIVANMYVVL